MIGYRDTLYVFGGEVGFSNGVETPLWMYNITVRHVMHDILEQKPHNTSFHWKINRFKNFLSLRDR